MIVIKGELIKMVRFNEVRDELIFSIDDNEDDPKSPILLFVKKDNKHTIP